MVLCHYDRVHRSKEKDPMYVVSEGMVMLIDRDVMFDWLESQICV